ncbi:MAG: PilC/PilY family type IV pilus protein, partial [Steroidobacteraceae bacterium]
DQPDGDALLTDSAAGRLPDAESRRVFSNVTVEGLTSAQNRMTPGNAPFSATVLGLGPQDRETPYEVISWLLNQRQLGDPGLQAPVIASDAGADSRTVYFATQDGLLHAIAADSGVERWAFIPRSLLARLPALMRNETTAARGHGIDGPLLLHRYDANGDGRIDAAAGEHLWLFFALGRGGSGYYALDVSSRDEPRLMWTLGRAELADGAESWAAPVISRLSVAGSGQSPGSWVVALAGGYDRAYDFADQPGDSSGASLSIHDAATGRRLWRAAGSVALMPDLQVPGMNASFASAPRILDMDGDGYADRLYIVDVSGGLWRMDLQNGAASAGLVRARLVASLGGESQRFYSSPDISIPREAGGLQLAISIGSGWLARPGDTRVTDRIYSIRDREQSGMVLHDEDLHDATDGVTAMPVGAPGWLVRLDAHGPGEKVIGSSLTFDHRLHFLTYQPVAAPLSSVCGPPEAVRRMRTFDVQSGLPINRLNLPEDPDDGELAGSGLPAALRFAFPGPWESACPGCRARPFGIIGGEIFDAGFANDPVKTSWRKLPIEPDSH